MDIELVQEKIFNLRGQRVMLDFDLALLYGVSTKALNQNIKRNIARFPIDFMFQLTLEEWEFMRSQIVTAYQQRRNLIALPYAFTEHGVTMPASTLRSEKAIQTNIAIVRAFITLREYTSKYKDISDVIEVLEKRYDRQFGNVYKAINYLLEKDKGRVSQEDKTRIGFKES